MAASDDAPVGGYLQAELLPSCAFDGRGRQVLRLKRHGRPVRRGDENGGTATPDFRG